MERQRYQFEAFEEGCVDTHICPNGKSQSRTSIRSTFISTMKAATHLLNDSSLQAIIRGLKESGVFTTAVTSAKAHAKLKSSNTDLKNKESNHPNITQGDHLQATVRKILEMVDAQEEAMPPMSPPGFLHQTVETALS